MKLKYFSKALRSRRITLNILDLIVCVRNPRVIGGILADVLGFKPDLFEHSSVVREDYRILAQLMNECRFKLDKRLMDLLLDKNRVKVSIGGELFLLECLEDLYHASLCYEPRTVRLVENHVSEGGVFVDVGANIGGYTVRLATKSKVYAFEPDPRNYSLLRTNLELNGRVASTYNLAAADETKKTRLYISRFHGRHSLVREGTGKYVEIHMAPLDDILEEEVEIDVMKVDAEGAEAEVIEGAKESLAKTNLVLVEAFELQVNPEAERLLLDGGFRCVGRTEGNLIYLSSSRGDT